MTIAFQNIYHLLIKKNPYWLLFQHFYQSSSVSSSSFCNKTESIHSMTARCRHNYQLFKSIWVNSKFQLIFLLKALLFFIHSDQFSSNFDQFYGFRSISIKTFQKNYTMLWNHAKSTKVATNATEWPLGRARRISPSKISNYFISSSNDIARYIASVGIQKIS